MLRPRALRTGCVDLGPRGCQRVPCAWCARVGDRASRTGRAGGAAAAAAAAAMGASQTRPEHRHQDLADRTGCEYENEPVLNFPSVWAPQKRQKWRIKVSRQVTPFGSDGRTNAVIGFKIKRWFSSRRSV